MRAGGAHFDYARILHDGRSRQRAGGRERPQQRDIAAVVGNAPGQRGALFGVVFVVEYVIGKLLAVYAALGVYLTYHQLDRRAIRLAVLGKVAGQRRDYRKFNRVLALGHCGRDYAHAHQHSEQQRHNFFEYRLHGLCTSRSFHNQL